MATKAANKTETQSYETLLSEGNFEVRYYPPAVMASVDMEGSYDSMKNRGFRTLAGYIFGDNRRDMKISMTSPVRFLEQQEKVRMSFVMPPSMDMGDLPQPRDSRIELHRSVPVYVASLRFSGYSDDEKIESMKVKLEQILEAKGMEHTGNFEYLGYNSPFKLFNRRNEVVVSLSGFDPVSALGE